MSEPIRSVDEYLDRLRQALSGADPALVQDATFDASEHLRSALEGAPEDAARLAPVIDEYGAPEEVAAAYRDTEATVAAALAVPRRRPRSRLERVFGVFVDPRAYTSLLFMLLTLPTGMAYFVWATAGVSLSLALVPLALLGVPLFLLFLGSARGIALVEGRIVEVLLGVRMPRRPMPPPAGTFKAGVVQRSLAWLRDPRSWTTVLYLALQLPLGLLWFMLGPVLLTVALSLIATPLIAPFVPDAHVSLDFISVPWGRWSALVAEVVGFGLLFVTLHLARLAGWIHARWARQMLVCPAPPARRRPAAAAVQAVTG